MKCPACRNKLTQKTVGDITVDVCADGCGGIWFDRFELDKVDEAHETAGAELLAIERKAGLDIDPGARLLCPRCKNVRMMRHFCSVKREVQVDECPACGGTWLDVGELALIRAQFADAQQRREATERFFDELFGDELSEMHGASEENQHKITRITRLFRFLCPSYYVPGKQSWGAF